MGSFWMMIKRAGRTAAIHLNVVDPAYYTLEPLQSFRWQRGAPVIILQPGGVTGAGDSAQHVVLYKFFFGAFQ